LLGLVSLGALASACDDGSDAPTAPDGASAPAADAAPAFPGFDRERERGEAQALIGVPESQLTERAELRIVRRGDESRPVTMDLRPGRKNVELDDDGSGRYVVTRVVVEVPDGQEPLVAE
jgi:hypothetical protein